MALSRTVKDVTGSVDSLRSEMKVNKKDPENLKEETSLTRRAVFKKTKKTRDS